MDVLLVAAKKEKIADYTGVIAQAGRQAVVVDVDAFALQNAYEVNYGIEPRPSWSCSMPAPAPPTSTSSMATSRSSRATSRSAATPTPKRSSRSSTCPSSRPTQLKRGLPVDGATFEDARPVLRAVTENVMLEIQKTFDFFKATASSDRIDRIMLSGGASRAEGFTEMLAERFESPVEAFDPFKRVGVRREEVRGGVAADMAPDGGGRGRSRAAPGGRPMIRINLLAVERGASQEERGAVIAAASASPSRASSS